MSSDRTEVSGALISEWRSSGLISAEEIVFKAGDLYVAENVITSTRRIITPPLTEASANRRVLKG